MAGSARPCSAVKRKLGGLLSLVLLAFACSPAGTSLERRDAGFAISMPGEATCAATVVVATAKGRLHQRYCYVEAHHWLEHSRGILPTTYTVSWFELPAGLSAREAVAILHAKEIQDGEGILHSESGRGDTLTERPISLAGEPGVEFKMRLLRLDPKLYFIDQTCSHQGRVYSLSLIGLLDAEGQRGWNRMLDSFRFTS